MLSDGFQVLELSKKLDLAEHRLRKAEDAYALLLAYTRSLENQIKEMERDVRPRM